MSEAGCTNPGCQELQFQVRRLEEHKERLGKELTRKVLRIGQLEKEAAERHDLDPKAREVRDILEEWQRCTGHTGCSIDQSTERWRKTRARLAQKPKEVLVKAIHAAATDDWYQGRHPRNRKRCDDIVTIFKNVETVERLAGIFDQTPRPAAQANGHGDIPRHVLESLAETCDCGHPAWRHQRPDERGWQACVVDGCDCFDFDTIDQQITAALDRHDRQRRTGVA